MSEVVGIDLGTTTFCVAAMEGGELDQLLIRHCEHAAMARILVQDLKGNLS